MSQRTGINEYLEHQKSKNIQRSKADHFMVEILNPLVNSFQSPFQFAAATFQTKHFLKKGNIAAFS